MTLRPPIAFLTVGAWEHGRDVPPESFPLTAAFARSAKRFGIDLHWIDYGSPWRGFFFHKIVRMREHLVALRDRGYGTVVYVDARDVLFLDGAEAIHEELGKFDRKQVLFAACMTKEAWPYRPSWFTERIKERFGSDGILNAGCFGGEVGAVLELVDECLAIRSRFQAGCPRQVENGETSLEETIFEETGTSLMNDDQFFFQLLQAKGSARIAVDTEKKLFAVFGKGWPEWHQREGQDPKQQWTICNARIIHSPWLSRDVAYWNKWSERIVNEAASPATEDRGSYPGNETPSASRTHGVDENVIRDVTWRIV